MKRTNLIIFFVLFLGSTAAWAEDNAVKTYYPSGKVQMEMNSHGQKTFYEDGVLMSEMVMKDGQPDGVAKFYHPNGKVMREDDYVHKHWKIFDESGKMISEGSY